MRIADIPEIVTISPFGRARVRGVIHEGPNHIVLRGGFGSPRIAIKVPRPDSITPNLRASSLWEAAETLHPTSLGGESCSLETAPPELSPELRFALMESECHALGKYGTAWNCGVIGVASF